MKSFIRILSGCAFVWFIGFLIYVTWPLILWLAGVCGAIALLVWSWT
jgi:hypothetical protein